MKAVIMAGGEGTRLRPLTCGLPKPMVPMLNKPIMEYIINLLKKYGIEDIAVTMAYLPEVIEDYFGDGSKWGVNLTYYIEKTPLGTGGSVKHAQDFLDETFIVISGDALTDINIEKAIAFHREKQSKATLVLKEEEIPLEYGVIVTDKSGKIIRFLEKPSWGEVFSDTINTGIYILEPEVMKYYKKGDQFDFSKDLFPKLLQDEIPMYGYVSKDYWCDVGDISTYMSSQFDILQGKVNLYGMQEEYKEIKKGVWVGNSVSYEENVQFISPIIIGENTYIKDGAMIGPNVVIGENSYIGENSTLKNSIIWANSYLGHKVQARGTTLCHGVAIGDRVNLYEKSVVGDEVHILSGVTVRPKVKIWPSKKVEENTIVNNHLVWTSKVSKAIFGDRGVCGQLNVDITPEFASQLGSAFGNVLKEKGKILVASDESNGTEMIKQALVSGILATGIEVIDIGLASLPLLRYGIRYFECQGGVYLSTKEEDLNEIQIEFMNEVGANIDRNMERSMENIFNRGDLKRIREEQMPKKIVQNNFYKTYMEQGLLFMKNLSKIKEKNPKIILASSSEYILFLGEEFLEKIGCQVNTIKISNKKRSFKNAFFAIKEKVKRHKDAIGVWIEKNGENIILFDEKGKEIDQEDYELLMHLILLKSNISRKVVVPYTFPEVIEQIAKEYEANVIRTKSAPCEVMNERLRMRENGQDKAFLFYLIYYDAIWAIGKIIDYLVVENVSLNEFRKEIPKYYYQKEHLSCHWKDKGRVIREIISQCDPKEMELFEGVKIKNSKGWSIILPDSEKPFVNLYTQGVSQEYAQELSEEFIEKIKRLIDKNKPT
ncbi:sugar phosphate nucleotidyltransferase [Garciella nitratireducens]|uniref:sugar phosphate nucleotidyltransferase n=1 Tax=Garciella nitratireducens TaxID=218205 RepID=UPI000DFD8CFA|nr:sugar phosphate nucleotidyltransferase [Garciella nitratireducens]RBP44151.1 mannose-1-phosphate guanylyltransferase/phosphomannomutase [Garciella nitratireducens]